uniref:G_PROTEIN_RECEP_F1_2 domain-containing protein n=1 Tax=Heterorhabditis bacteriophora TaxID=37862 RepID=A0A1I7XI25_HETBA
MAMNFHLYIISFFTIIISSFGIFGNINVIWAVRKCKELRVKHGTGALLASLCFYQSICLIFELIGSIRIMTQYQTSEKLCYYSILPLIVANNIQLSLVLITALDLVLLVLRPTVYQRIQTLPYCCFMQIPCYVYAFTAVLLSVFHLRDIPILDYENLKKTDGSCIMDPSMRYQRKLIKSLSALMTVFFVQQYNLDLPVHCSCEYLTLSLRSMAKQQISSKATPYVVDNYII